MSVHSQIRNDWALAIKEANRNSALQAEAKLINAEIYWDMDTMFGKSDSFKIYAGKMPEDQFIQKLGHERCKKYEATLLVIIGEQREGCWVIGKSKNIWLKPKQAS